MIFSGSVLRARSIALGPQYELGWAENTAGKGKAPKFEGFKPLILAYIIHIPSAGLYWVNIVSAVLDNATLAAAEIGPDLSLSQIVSALMGLLIAGGMLIPGNIPNIIAACKLEITSREWAEVGVPLGLVLMVFFFVILFVPGLLGF